MAVKLELRLGGRLCGKEVVAEGAMKSMVLSLRDGQAVTEKDREGCLSRGETQMPSPRGQLMKVSRRQGAARASPPAS